MSGTIFPSFHGMSKGQVFARACQHGHELRAADNTPVDLNPTEKQLQMRYDDVVLSASFSSPGGDFQVRRLDGKDTAISIVRYGLTAGVVVTELCKDSSGQIRGQEWSGSTELYTSSDPTESRVLAPAEANFLFALHEGNLRP